MKRILLADKNPDLCSALSLLLRTRLEAQIVGQVCQIGLLLNEAAASQPEIIIVDWELLAADAQGNLQELHRLSPLSKIIVTGSRPEFTFQAQQAGADAFVCKIYPPEALLSAIQGSEYHV
jgi:DNA-binding NarL/FixJ family response regulator